MKKTLFLLSLLSFLFIACENEYDWTNPLDQESEVLPESWAPRNLQLQKISDTQIMLTWEQDEKRIEGFRIERKVDNGSWQSLVQLGANERSYTDSGLDTSKTYLYKICAFISGKQSKFSNEVVIFLFLNVRDIDGNVYKILQIGNQVWMAENLKVTRYRNGDTIPSVTDNSQWASLTTGARCAYNNINGNVAAYGLLYNWYAVNDSRELAPAGWRVPTDADWQTLVDYLGGSLVTGGKLKATGTIEAGAGLWRNPNSGATNESGFTALPGGYRHYTTGTFGYIGNYGYWWSTTESNSTFAWVRNLYYDNSAISRYNAYMRHGFSVRCVRD